MDIEAHWAGLAREGLTPPGVARDCTGRDCRVAVIDTGINFSHPHLALPSRSVHVVWRDDQAVVENDVDDDRFGHGTCCAALIHSLAPEAELWSVRVTSERPFTDRVRLTAAMDWASRE